MKNSRKIRTIYIVYLSVLLILMLIFLLYARKSLILYEASQPDYIMDSLVNQLHGSMTPSSNTTLSSNITLSDYESMDDYLGSIEQMIAESGLTYQKTHESYTDGALTYTLSAGDVPWAEAVLIPTQTTSRMLVLTISDYSLSSLNLIQPQTNYSLTITLPESYSASVNGLQLSEDVLTETVDNPLLTYCGEYIDVPGEATYEINGLMNLPEVTIYREDGSICSDTEMINNEDSFHPVYQVTYVSSDPPEEIREMVLSSVETYSNFFSKDLMGCQQSVDPIRHLFPEDSLYLALADQYRREDMGVFASHTNTHYLNEVVSEYTIYNENCFSVRVQFDKSMTLGSGKEVIDTTDNIYYFINVDNQWVIADIQ